MLFLFLYFRRVADDGVSPILQCSDNTQFVNQWVIRVEGKVLICVCYFSEDFSLQTIWSDLYKAVEEREAVVIALFLCEFDVSIYTVQMLKERCQLLFVDYHKSVIHIPQPNPWR